MPLPDLHLTITPAPMPQTGAVSKFASGGRASSAPSILTNGPTAGTAENAPSFGGLLTDVINPLQHIPILGHIYRAVSGDTIEPAAQVAGGTLFGGPIGGLISLASAVFTELFSSDSQTPATSTKVAGHSPAGHNPARPDIYRV